MRRILRTKKLDLLDDEGCVAVTSKLLGPMEGKEDRTYPAVCFELMDAEGQYLSFTVDKAQLMDAINEFQRLS